VLAERLTAGESDDLRAQLPGELHGDLIPPEPEAEPFGPDGGSPPPEPAPMTSVGTQTGCRWIGAGCGAGRVQGLHGYVEAMTERLPPTPSGARSPTTTSKER
jgi:hypothetical protein